MAVEEKIKYADYVINNSKSIDYTLDQVKELLDKAIDGGIE